MALRDLGSISAEFGTGDATILSKEIVMEARINEPLIRYDGKVDGHVVSGLHTIERSSRYGSLNEANSGLPQGVTKMSINASNEDFVRVQEETESYE